MITVTQEDRDAAAVVFELYGAKNYADLARVGSVHVDGLGAVQAFAAHREAAEARARLEGMEIMREAAARAVEGEHLEDPQTADDDAYGAALIHAAEAIRNIDPTAILEAHTGAKAMDGPRDADLETGCADDRLPGSAEEWRAAANLLG